MSPVTTEASHSLESEGDVERASALYLIHDICIILEKALFPVLGIQEDQFKCVGQSTDGRSRTDIKFVVNGKTVLILEFKKTNTLVEADWVNGALVTERRSAQQIIGGMPLGNRTALQGNAGVISQQARKYSDKCPVVVIFNYQHMIVLDFAPAGEPFNDRTNPVQFHFSSDSSPTHKQLLLATMIHGMKKANVVDKKAWAKS